MGKTYKDDNNIRFKYLCSSAGFIIAGLKNVMPPHSSQLLTIMFGVVTSDSALLH